MYYNTEGGQGRMAHRGTASFAFLLSVHHTSQRNGGLIPVKELTFVSQNLKFGLTFFSLFPGDWSREVDHFGAPVVQPLGSRVVQEAKIGTRFTGSCR
jgi:hypothetical protein